MRCIAGHKRRVVISWILLTIAGIAAVGPASTAEATATSGTWSSVRDVQTRLAALKFLPASQVDGTLGPRTRDAVTAFQQWNRLTPDGTAGPLTLASLRNAAIPKPGDKGPGRRIEVYRARGITMLIDRGKVSRVMHSSAGKRGYETPTGTYRILRKVTRDWSHPYNVWMPYASYFHHGYAFHEGSVPPYPASHGCVRLPWWDATEAYRFATIGTAVIVY
jgi:lipoprotein-anchoring transpeptidase ErfK/SrfK